MYSNGTKTEKAGKKNGTQIKNNPWGYDTGVSAEYGDKLITLSTCEYSRTNGRLVVVAKKVTESSGANAPANDGAAEIPS